MHKLSAQSQISSTKFMTHHSFSEEKMSAINGNTGINWKYLIVKVLIFQVMFLILHYMYDFFPSPFTSVISGTSEAVFQHIKIGFFAYIILSAGEYLIYRKKVKSISQLVYARIFSTTLLPWVIFILFFMAPAYYGHIGSIPIEIIYANIVLLSATTIMVIMEAQIEVTPLSKEFKVAILILFLILMSLFIIFSHKDPWHDVFAIPPGWE